MWRVDIPYVLAVKPSQIVWTPPPEPESPWEAADRLRWGASNGETNDADHPGAWTAVVRRFHDGHEETWWAVDLWLGSYAPEYPTCLVVATSDQRTLPEASTWLLVTNLPLPGTTRAAAHPGLPAADLKEVAQLYGPRQWVEQGYKQVKYELGWADYQMRPERAIVRQWPVALGDARLHLQSAGGRGTPRSGRHSGDDAPSSRSPSERVGGGKNQGQQGQPPPRRVEPDAAPHAGMALPLGSAAALLETVVVRRPTVRAGRAPRPRRILPPT